MKVVSKLIILDANVIIVAHKLGFWKKLVSYYKIHIPAIIIQESKYFEDSFGQKINIDLSKELKNNSVIKIEASAEKMQIFYNGFKKNFLESIDDGEKEALAILYSHTKTDLLFCTGDMRAICALSIMGISECGISLEKVLITAGISTKNIAKHFSDEAFKHQLLRGFQEKEMHKKN